MHDLAAALVRVEDPCPAQRPGVSELTAALGEEGRAVEHDAPALFQGLAGEDDGGEFGQMAVMIV